jgi:aryl-alcohol dehydrogenase-like predicted oxidoreductase
MRSSPQDLRKALDGSLLRLGVECIDLYQIHLATSPEKVDTYMQVLAEAVQAGKIRAVGVSNYSASLMHRAHASLAHYGIALASNQVHYSLLHRYPETNGVLDACRELQVALLAYSPLEQGVLTGKYRSKRMVMPGARRRRLSLFLRLDLPGDTRGQVPAIQRLLSTPRAMRHEQLEPLFVVLEEIAHAHKKTIAQVALNWLVIKERCIIPLPGAKNAHQARENAGALGWCLTEEEQARISQAETASR